MATVHTTGNFAELLWPGINEIWGNTYKSYDPLYTKFFNIESSDKAFEKDQQITGLPKAGVKEEGNEATFEQIFQGYQKEYRHLTYALGAIVTEEMVEDDQYNQIKRIPQFLARSVRETEEIVAHNVLNNAFNTAFTGADGSALIATNHVPVAGGANQANRPNTATDLTITALENAVEDIMQFKDDQGLRILVKGMKLVVPAQLAVEAQKLLDTEYIPGSADNDVNVVKSKYNMTVIPTPYLTDPDAWFICTDVEDGLKFFNRRAATIDRDKDFDTDNLKIKVTRRFSTGFTDWRGVYGSPGAT